MGKTNKKIETEVENVVDDDQLIEDGNHDEIEETLTPAETYDDLMTQFKTKSAVIRHLHGRGQTTSAIAKFMNIRYQHVRNVLTQPLKTK